MDSILRADLPEHPGDEGWTEASRRSDSQTAWADRPLSDEGFQLDNDLPQRPGSWIVWTEPDVFESVDVDACESAFEIVGPSVLDDKPAD